MYQAKHAANSAPPVRRSGRRRASDRAHGANTPAPYPSAAAGWSSCTSCRWCAWPTGSIEGVSEALIRWQPQAARPAGAQRVPRSRVRRRGDIDTAGVLAHWRCPGLTFRSPHTSARADACVDVRGAFMTHGESAPGLPPDGGFVRCRRSSPGPVLTERGRAVGNTGAALHGSVRELRSMTSAPGARGSRCSCALPLAIAEAAPRSVYLDAGDASTSHRRGLRRLSRALSGRWSSVAEGVGDRGQRLCCCGITGCLLAQGWLFGQP